MGTTCGHIDADQLNCQQERSLSVVSHLPLSAVALGVLILYLRTANGQVVIEITHGQLFILAAVISC